MDPVTEKDPPVKLPLTEEVDPARIPARTEASEPRTVTPMTDTDRRIPRKPMLLTDTATTVV